MVERRDDDLAGRADRFGRYLDALSDDARPAPESVADAEEAAMARLAVRLRTAGEAAEGAAPDPAFIEQGRRRMAEVDAGIRAVRGGRPQPSASPPGRLRITRRQLLAAGMAAVGGIAAGMAGASLMGRREADEPNGLVGAEGVWVPVATLDELPPGAALRFSTPAFDGFVVNDGGEVRALSAICTHLPCTLEFRRAEAELQCPCHGARFDLDGRLANGSRARLEGTWADDEAPYPVDLPPLARPRVRVADGEILVWTARA